MTRCINVVASWNDVIYTCPVQVLLRLGLYIQASFSCAPAQGTELCTKETPSPMTVPSFQMYYSARSII